MRRHSIAEARGKLSREWLAEGPIELTANNVVIATIFPTGMTIAAQNVVPSVNAISEGSGPNRRGVASLGLSKTAQGSGKSRCR